MHTSIDLHVMLFVPDITYFFPFNCETRDVKLYRNSVANTVFFALFAKYVDILNLTLIFDTPP